MSETKFKGQPVSLSGNFPKVGSVAPSFELVGQDLGVSTLDTFKDKKKVLNIFISLDTPVCSKSVHAFNAEASKLDNTVILNISMDLPFAATRFCKDENLKNVITLQAFRSTFGEDYGVKIAKGALQSLCARAVLVLDKDNKVLYARLCPEITEEPDYTAALNALL